MKKIFIIDDSALMRRILCDIIVEDERFTVASTAKDGEEALKILENEKDNLSFAIEGEGHTLVNALVEELLLNPQVDVAKYVIEFQFSDPVVTVTMKPKSKQTPEKAVLAAIETIISRCDDLLSCLKN